MLYWIIGVISIQLFPAKAKNTLPVRQLEKQARHLVVQNMAAPATDTWDALHYRLELKIDPEQQQIYGKADIDAASLVTGLDELELNLVALTVDNIFAGNQPIDFIQTSQTLLLVLDQAGSRGCIKSPNWG